MGAGSSSEDSLLMRAVDSIGKGTTLDEAFQSLVDVLLVPLELWYACLTVLRPDSPTTEFVATWSLASSVFEPGTQLSTSISEPVRTTTAALYEGEVVINSVPSRPESIVNALMREQGVGAVVSVPVHRDAAGVLVLTLGSSEEAPLQAVGVPFYRGMAAGIEERLVQLVASRTS